MFFLAAAAATTLHGQTAVQWQSAASGDWFTAANWSPAVVPDFASPTTYRAIVAAAGPAYTVTASGSNNVDLTGLDVSSANARVVFDFTSTGLGLNLGAGLSTISAGNVEFRTARLAGSGTTSTTVALASGAELLFSTSTATRTLSSLALNNSGTLRANSGGLSLSSLILNNQTPGSLVHADGAEITFQSNVTLTNGGTLRATGTGGILRFQNATTTAGLGAVDLVDGGRAILQNTVNNTAGTLAKPGSGSFELLGATITGGTIAPGALTFTGSNGTLSGATLQGDLVLPASTYVTLSNGATFTGANLTLGNSAYVYWQQAGTLAGKSLVFGTGSLLYINNTNNALTLAANSTATGEIQIYSDGSNGTAFTNQGAITHTSGSGQIYARTLTNAGQITATAGTLTIGANSASYATSNTGTITASGSGTLVNLNGNVANTGTVIAQNQGIVRFTGSNVTGNVGTVQLTNGGRAQLNGTLTNTTLNAPSGGTFELLGGTISGGTIAPGALTFTGSNGTLSGATLQGDLVLPASTYVTLSNGATFTGANLTLGNSAYVYWQQAGTLSGKSLAFGTGSLLYVNNTNNTLTLAANSTASGDIQIYSDGSNGTAFTNQGVITHTSGSGQIYARSLANAGQITATAGTLTIGANSTSYATSNTGTITASGSGTLVNLNGDVANTGTIIAQNAGIVRFTGNNVTGNVGTVQLTNGGRAQLNGTLTNTTLNAPSGGTFELLGGTISGGTIAPGALTFTSSHGTLSGATLQGDLVLPASTYVTLSNGATFTGANLTLGNSAYVYWQQAGTLAGKSLVFGTGSLVYINNTNNALTLAANSTATGDIQIYSDGSNGTAFTNLGTITHTSGSGQIYARTLTNAGQITATAGTLTIGTDATSYATSNTGTITASGPGTLVYLDGNVANTGTVIAQNQGIVRFTGSNVTGNVGTVQLTNGGRAQLNGTLTNTTLNAPSGGTFELLGGTISGGTIAPGALTFTNSNGTLSGATLQGDLVLPASTYVTLSNGATFTGANLTLGNSAYVYWQQAGTLSGKSLAFGTGSLVYINNTNNALTFAANSTATGDIQIYSDGSNGTAFTNQGVITHTSGSGQIYARTLANAGQITATAGTLTIGTNSASYATSNTGTITASGSGTLVYLNGNVANTGSIIAQNQGVVRFTGSNTTANLGAVQIAASGGRVQLNGLLDNTSDALDNLVGGAFELLGGTITGGTIPAGALTYTGSNGTLSGVTLQDNLTLPNNTYVSLTNDTTFTGASLTLGNSAYVYWQQSGTLAGKSLAFGNGSLIYLNGANRTLTLAPNSTATGDIQIYSDGSAGTAFTNQGTLTHTTGSGQIYGRSVTNSGSIVATAGSLSLGTSAAGYTFANTATGTLTVAGANLFLNAPGSDPIVNQGRIDVQSGTLFTNARLINGATGTIGGAGTINGGLTLNGGTLAPGNSIGTLTFSGGAFNVTSASIFAYELGGTAADRIVFVNPNAPVDLGAGLVTLSLTLLSAPALNTSFELVRINSGGSGITGSFANLPLTGSTLTANFAGTPYLFSVSYQMNTISLQSIPEPGTYALIGAGLVVLFFVQRRRRG